MLNGQKIIVIMPAYNAEATLRKTHDEVMAQGVVDRVIVVDDASNDRTMEIAASLPATAVHQHEKNRGYGGNQKTCYKMALEAGADIVIMVHPDYQYTPSLIPAMASLIANGLYHCVLGSRILGGYALKGDMPVWKYIANRFLTLAENMLTGAKLSEYHTGYRAFSKKLLEKLPLDQNSDDFVFRQSDACPDIVARLADRRDNLPDEIFCGSLFNQFHPERQVWVRLPRYRREISLGENETDQIKTVSFAVKRTQ